MRWPLRHQIMGPLLVVAVISLAAVAAIHARLTGTQTRQRIEQRLSGVVGVLASSNFPLTAPVLAQMRDLSSAEFVLTDSAGRVAAASFESAGASLSPTRTLQRPDDVVLGAGVTIAGREYFHTSVRLASTPKRSDDADDAQSGRVLHVLFPRDEYNRNIRQAYLPPLLVGLAAVAAIAVVARLLAGRISRATAKLGNEVQRLARGDFGPVELPAVDDEIRDLAGAVNRTAEMLADYEQQIRRTEQMRTVGQLGASLAHELRNAATGCRMAVDLHIESCCCGSDNESMVVAQRQLKLMETQLQRFLRIGRSEAEPVHRRVALAQLIEDLLPLVRPAARHAGVSLQWQADDRQIFVSGDAEGLYQAALNLVLNAVEAAQLPAAGAERRVLIQLTSDGDHAELSVTDTGPGPATATATGMFDPFVTSKAEGAGLGLAVVRQVAEAHGGTIAWSRDDGVTEFRLRLPRTEKEVSRV
jgi:signal transduction histidine kinase